MKKILYCVSLLQCDSIQATDQQGALLCSPCTWASSTLISPQLIESSFSAWVSWDCTENASVRLRGVCVSSGRRSPGALWDPRALLLLTRLYLLFKALCHKFEENLEPLHQGHTKTAVPCSPEVWSELLQSSLWIHHSCRFAAPFTGDPRLWAKNTSLAAGY